MSGQGDINLLQLGTISQYRDFLDSVLTKPSIERSTDEPPFNDESTYIENIDDKPVDSSTKTSSDERSLAPAIGGAIHTKAPYRIEYPDEYNKDLRIDAQHQKRLLENPGTWVTFSTDVTDLADQLDKTDYDIWRIENTTDIKKPVASLNIRFREDEDTLSSFVTPIDTLALLTIALSKRTDTKTSSVSVQYFGSKLPHSDFNYKRLLTALSYLGSVSKFSAETIDIESQQRETDEELAQHLKGGPSDARLCLLVKDAMQAIDEGNFPKDKKSAQRTCLNLLFHLTFLLSHLKESRTVVLLEDNERNDIARLLIFLAAKIPEMFPDLYDFDLESGWAMYARGIVDLFEKLDAKEEKRIQNALRHEREEWFGRNFFQSIKDVAYLKRFLHHTSNMKPREGDDMRQKLIKQLSERLGKLNPNPTSGPSEPAPRSTPSGY